jgi:hypothetical protein
MIVDERPRSFSMSCKSVVVLTLLLGSLIVAPKTSAQSVTLAQLTPQAGSAGAGNSAINGIPAGPANPSVLYDPSGIGNASRLPPLGTNTPAVNAAPAPVITSPRPTTAPVVGASQRIFVPVQTNARRRPFRGRVQAQVSKFTGICRGC